MSDFLKESRSQFVNFCLVGIVGATINYSIFFLLYNFLRVNYIISSGTGFVLSLAAAFFLNKRYTFKTPSDREYKIIGLKYILVNLFSLSLGLICLRFFVEALGFNTYLANFLIIGIQTTSNFIGSKLFAFR